MKTFKQIAEEHPCPQCQAEGKPKCVEYLCIRRDAIEDVKHYIKTKDMDYQDLIAYLVNKFEIEDEELQ